MQVQGQQSTLINVSILINSSFNYSLTLILLFLLSWACTSKKEEKSLEFGSQIIFPLQQEHVHGPSIVELPNGDLLAAWFQGSGERWADDVRIMGSRLPQGDTTWSAPFLMADTPDFPDINPILFMDTKKQLWLMWYPVIANQWETSIPKYRISTDYTKEGAPVWTWQDIILVKPGDKTERGIQPNDKFVLDVRRQLDEYEDYLKSSLLAKLPKAQQNQWLIRWNKYRQDVDSLAGGKNMIRSGKMKVDETEQDTALGYPLSRRIGWQTKNKPQIIGDRIIVPLYSDGLNCSLFAMTDDFGQTWQFSNPVIGGIGIQPTMAVSKDGRLSAYLRDNGPPRNECNGRHPQTVGILGP